MIMSHIKLKRSYQVTESACSRHRERQDHEEWKKNNIRETKNHYLKTHSRV
jgi:hypothetical protein